MTVPNEPNRTTSSARVAGTVILVLALAAAAFHMYAAGVSPFTALVQRPVHLALMAVMGFLGLGIRRSGGEAASGSAARRVMSGVLIVGVLFTCGYLIVQHETLVRRAGVATPLDLAAGILAIVVVLELTRRTTGWGLLAVAALALVYAVAGPYLPGLLAHRGYGVSRLVQHLYLSTEGIWGVPLGVSADFVYLFVLFGAVLEVAGGGQLLIAIASRIAGKSRGGPAKTAALASAIMGSLSGSAVANVVTTGAFTIPMMKRTGFKPYFAGAIEAAASTGGQLMPPVMGAGAFILATWTNIPYISVALAALIPAVLYYVTLFMAIHFRAGARALEPVTVPLEGSVWSRLYLLVPLVVVVVMLGLGRSPMRSAFWGVASAAAFTMLLPATRLGWDGVKRAVLSAARGTVQIAAATAAAGIVVGVASLTGVGLRMSELIVRLSGGQLPIALVLTALGSIVLGMGLPTTAAYVVLAALGAPALTELGVPVLSAHLFIFYYGCLSNVTPPVALAAYAGAGVAGATPMRTATTAMILAGAGFLIPFVFIYEPALLLSGSVLEIVIATLRTGVGLIAIASAGIGFGMRPLDAWERVALGVGGALALAPSAPFWLLGALVIGAVTTMQFTRVKRDTIADNTSA